MKRLSHFSFRTLIASNKFAQLINIRKIQITNFNKFYLDGDHRFQLPVHCHITNMDFILSNSQARHICKLQISQVVVKLSHRVKTYIRCHSRTKYFSRLFRKCSLQLTKVHTLVSIRKWIFIKHWKINLTVKLLARFDFIKLSLTLSVNSRFITKDIIKFKSSRALATNF